MEATNTANRELLLEKKSYTSPSWEFNDIRVFSVPNPPERAVVDSVSERTSIS